MIAWALAFHILGVVFWIGGLMVAASIMSSAAKETGDKAAEVLRRQGFRIFKTMAAPGAAITVLAGIWVTACNSSYYLRAGWLHAKLSLVLVLIVLHVLAHRKAKAEARAGELSGGPGYWMKMHGAISLIFAAILILVFPVAVNWE